MPRLSLRDRVKALFKGHKRARSLSPTLNDGGSQEERLECPYDPSKPSTSKEAGGQSCVDMLRYNITGRPDRSISTSSSSQLARDCTLAPLERFYHSCIAPFDDHTCKSSDNTSSEEFRPRPLQRLDSKNDSTPSFFSADSKDVEEFQEKKSEAETLGKTAILGLHGQLSRDEERRREEVFQKYKKLHQDDYTFSPDEPSDAGRVTEDKSAQVNITLDAASGEISEKIPQWSHTTEKAEGEANDKKAALSIQVENTHIELKDVHTSVQTDNTKRKVVIVGQSESPEITVNIAEQYNTDGTIGSTSSNSAINMPIAITGQSVYITIGGSNLLPRASNLGPTVIAGKEDISEFAECNKSPVGKISTSLTQDKSESFVHLLGEPVEVDGEPPSLTENPPRSDDTPMGGDELPGHVSVPAVAVDRNLEENELTAPNDLNLDISLVEAEAQTSRKDDAPEQKPKLSEFIGNEIFNGQLSLLDESNYLSFGGFLRKTLDVLTVDGKESTFGQQNKLSDEADDSKRGDVVISEYDDLKNDVVGNATHSESYKKNVDSGGIIDSSQTAAGQNKMSLYTDVSEEQVLDHTDTEQIRDTVFGDPEHEVELVGAGGQSKSADQKMDVGDDRTGTGGHYHEQKVGNCDPHEGKLSYLAGGGNKYFSLDLDKADEQYTTFPCRMKTDALSRPEGQNLESRTESDGQCTDVSKSRTVENDQTDRAGGTDLDRRVSDESGMVDVFRLTQRAASETCKLQRSYTKFRSRSEKIARLHKYLEQLRGERDEMKGLLAGIDRQTAALRNEASEMRCTVTAVCDMSVAAIGKETEARRLEPACYRRYLNIRTPSDATNALAAVRNRIKALNDLEVLIYRKQLVLHHVLPSVVQEKAAPPKRVNRPAHKSSKSRRTETTGAGQQSSGNIIIEVVSPVAEPRTPSWSEEVSHTESPTISTPLSVSNEVTGSVQLLPDTEV